MATYDNTYPVNTWIKDSTWIKDKIAESDYADTWIKDRITEDDYKKMMPDPFHHRDINDLIQNIIDKDQKSSSRRKGTKNHLGVFEDVKQPLTLDPVLDF